MLPQPIPRMLAPFRNKIAIFYGSSITYYDYYYAKKTALKLDEKYKS
jgi:hypothetical protein